MGWFPRRWAAPDSPRPGAAHFRARWKPVRHREIRMITSCRTRFWLSTRLRRWSWCGSALTAAEVPPVAAGWPRRSLFVTITSALRHPRDSPERGRLFGWIAGNVSTRGRAKCWSRWTGSEGGRTEDAVGVPAGTRCCVSRAYGRRDQHGRYDRSQVGLIVSMPVSSRGKTRFFLGTRQCQNCAKTWARTEATRIVRGRGPSPTGSTPGRASTAHRAHGACFGWGSSLDRSWFVWTRNARFLSRSR
jgi:hypothetical protein